jgi:hypothetical protein
MTHWPTAPTSVCEVFVSVPGADPSIVYNTPNSTMTIFPGEDHGLHAPEPGLDRVGDRDLRPLFFISHPTRDMLSELSDLFLQSHFSK